ncbi:MAG: hypothetical protein ACYTFA_16480 [Planctomycetota bacterium]|jgi:hypothetical protein
MTPLERRIRTVQRRLWFNRWLGAVSWTLCAAAGLFGATVLVQRLYDFPAPILLISLALGGIALIVSIVWTVATREDSLLAAAKLDEAAGLRERLSSGRFCLGLDDPFARACVADAQQVSSSLSPRQHIPLTAPRQISFTVVSIVAAAMMFLVTPGLLKSSEATEVDLQRELTEQTKVAVKRKLDEVRRLAETNPALEDLKEELEGLDKHAGGMLQKPGDVRHEAVKKIDKLADVVRNKRKAGNYEAVREMRKMMRGLKPPQSDEAPTQKLAQALAAGDFKTAREEMKALREQLATLKSDKDKDLAAKLSKQLDALAKQLEQVAKNEKLAKKLEQAGLKKEDIERMLQNLRKKDLDQLKKELQEKGWNQQQIQKLAEQLKQQQKAGRLAQKLAQQMGRGARAAGGQQGAETVAGLSMAADQLSELEQLEQEMNQLDAALAGLQTTRNTIDKPCSACQGTGMVNGRPCGACQGRGGMGNLGQGRGGLAPEQQTAVDFKTERAKVHTGKGAIIGQFLVDGEQVKGDVSSSLAEVISAAERDASDRINRDRVPRQYQKAVKTYFSNVQRLTDDAPAGKPNASSSDDESETRP